jgi:hypothetical protein
LLERTSTGDGAAMRIAAVRTHTPISPSDRVLRLLPTIGAIALISFGLLGCGSELGYHGFNFKNQTDVRITISRFAQDGTEVVVVTGIDAGLMYSALGFPGLTSSGGTCQDMTLIARDPQKAEVARLAGRVCMDEEWVIRRPAPTGAPSG